MGGKHTWEEFDFGMVWIFAFGIWGHMNCVFCAFSEVCPEVLEKLQCSGLIVASIYPKKNLLSGESVKCFL